MTAVLGDILDVPVEVVVSSDDNQLSMSGGVSKALLAAGGEWTRRDAAKQAPAAVGSIVVGTAGEMDRRYVFHAITREDGVPPSDDRERHREIVASATRQALSLLREMKLTSIEFPALGTGFAGFKVEDVACEMARAMIEDLTLSKGALSVYIVLREQDVGENVDYQAFFNRFDDQSGLRHEVLRSHAVFMIHGIRTEAAWYESVSTILKAKDPRLYPVYGGYGFFDTFSFLLPLGTLRQRAVQKVKEKLEPLRRNPEIRQISVVAHSFGTHILGELMRQDSTLKLHRVLLCGSILPENFKWETLAAQIDPLPGGEHATHRVINDCGWLDIWPVLAHSATWGYGQGGRFGFRTPAVIDRFHKLGHSGFFGDDFVERYWLPLLSRGIVVDGPRDRENSPWWIQAIGVAKLRYVLPLVLLLGFVWLWR
ncbi:MAG: macro domain-containing protein [Burkholderiaceae bacterium]|nr:macro domain-containing protein [Burkholderiaceae bacterium]